MKILAIGDLHGNNKWVEVVQKETFDKIVFVGDYFDSFIYSAVEQIANFKMLIDFKKSNPEKCHLLIGNHDHHYFYGMNDNTEGYQMVHASSIQYELEENKHLLEMSITLDNKYLFSHAGISTEYMNMVFGENEWDLENISEYINDIWRYKPALFKFNSDLFDIKKCGENPNHSPIWIRPRSLMMSSKDIKKRWIQVVGHTAQNKIDIKGKSTGGRYYFIDVFNTNNEYIIFENDNVYSKKLSDN